MILAIADVLSAADVADVCAGLATATFVDGKATAGWSARLVKANLQAAAGPELERVRALVEQRLTEHAVFALAVRPKTMLGPLFSRYEPGHAYGAHVDDALMGGVRTDVSFTLFLSPPDSYDGGELVIDSASGEEAFKLARRQRRHLSVDHAASRGAGDARRAAGGGRLGAQLHPRCGAPRAAVRPRDGAAPAVRSRRQDGRRRPARQVRRQPPAHVVRGLSESRSA